MIHDGPTRDASITVPFCFTANRSSSSHAAADAVDHRQHQNANTMNTTYNHDVLLPPWDINRSTPRKASPQSVEKERRLRSALQERIVPGVARIITVATSMWEADAGTYAFAIQTTSALQADHSVSLF